MKDSVNNNGSQTVIINNEAKRRRETMNFKGSFAVGFDSLRVNSGTL